MWEETNSIGNMTVLLSVSIESLSPMAPEDNSFLAVEVLLDGIRYLA